MLPPEDEVAAAEVIGERWAELVQETQLIQNKLGPTKKKFAIVTTQHVREFNRELATTCQAMRDAGPASAEVDLEVP